MSSLMEEKIKKEIGSRIKRARNVIGKTQEDLAKEIDFNRSLIGHYETGHTAPSIEFLLLLSRYDISIEWVLTGSGDMFKPKMVSAINDGEVQQLVEDMDKDPALKHEVLSHYYMVKEEIKIARKKREKRLKLKEKKT